MVDGVLASCYASFDHDLAHLMVTPMQWFPGMVEWMFEEVDGVPGYVTMVKSLGRAVLPSDLTV